MIHEDYPEERMVELSSEFRMNCDRISKRGGAEIWLDSSEVFHIESRDGVKGLKHFFSFTHGDTGNKCCDFQLFDEGNSPENIKGCFHSERSMAGARGYFKRAEGDVL